MQSSPWTPCPRCAAPQVRYHPAPRPWRAVAGGLLLAVVCAADGLGGWWGLITPDVMLMWAGVPLGLLVALGGLVMADPSQWHCPVCHYRWDALP